MQNSIIKAFVSLAVYVVMASAEQPITWTNPFFYYHYNNPIALPPQKILGNDESVSNTLESHAVLISNCVRELKKTKTDLGETTKLLSNTNTAVDIIQAKLDDLKKVVETKTDLAETKKLLSNTNTAVDIIQTKLGDLKKVVDERTNPIVDIGKTPTSCADLKQSGNKVNGFYSVKGKNNIQTVYCNFVKPEADPSFQSLIGSVDIKTFPVYFYATKIATGPTYIYSTHNSPIPFETLQLNVGNAFNPSTGLFVAPKPGKYFFSFTGLSSSNSDGRVDLQMKNPTTDWVRIQQAYGDRSHKILSLQSTLQLNSGDQIRLALREGAIHDGIHTQNTIGPLSGFSGWLIEEDIV